MTVMMPKGDITLVPESPVNDRTSARQQRAGQIAEKYAVIMAEREIRARVITASSPAPAWSTSNTITFNANHLGDLDTPLQVASFKGLQVHELCHILFTPRQGSKIATWVKQNKLHKYFNMLEDMRIETLWTALYPSTTAWLKATIYQHLLGDGCDMSRQYALIVGRKYVNAQVRRTLRDQYVNQHHVAELKSLVDTYRLLTFSVPADVETAKVIIERYAELLKEAGVSPDPESGEGGCGGTHGSHEPSGEGGRPAGSGKQKKAKSKATDAPVIDEDDVEPLEPDNEDLTDEDFDFGDPDDSDDDTDGDSTDGDDTDGDDTDGDDSTDGGDSTDGDDTDGDDTDGDDADGEGTDGDDSQDGGKTAGTGGNSLPVSAKDLLKDALDNLLDIYGDQLADDIARINGELELSGNGVAVPDDAKWQTGSVSAEARKGAYEFGRALEQLRTEFDPNWEQEVEAGRLNIDRFMQEDVDLSEAFDRWEMGREDAVDIECVILLDKSGSMRSDIGRAYQSMWGIKSALDKVDASCTVVTFGSGAEVLYHADERATNNLRDGGVGGGTEPLHALKYAQDVLANSARAIKLAVFITDGDWSQADKCDEVIKTLRDGGVLTTLAYIGGGWVNIDEVNAHGAESKSIIANASQLFGLGKQMVEIAISKNLVK